MSNITDHMKIGELARRAGVTPRTLRYYESLGLLRPAARPGGFRLYGEDALRRLERIRELKELLGFTLEGVHAILVSEDAVAGLRASHDETEDRATRAGLVRAAARQVARQRESVRRRLGALQAMDDALAERQRLYAQILAPMTPGG